MDNNEMIKDTEMKLRKLKRELLESDINIILLTLVQEIRMYYPEHKDRITETYARKIVAHCREQIV